MKKKILGCFRSMSRLFNDHTKSEEYLNMLHQIKDANIWNIFTSLLDCSTTFNEAWSLRVPATPFDLQITDDYFVWLAI